MLERLQKFLARAGVASRRKAEELIDAGRVMVNGVVVRKMGVQVDPAADEVRLDTEVVKASGSAGPSARSVYLAMNKPVGFLCTVSDDRGRRTVMELLPRLRERVFPVGRLDEDSEGLLLLTNDGELTNLLTHPRYEVAKTYDLRVRGEVTPEDVLKVERGVWLSEGRTAPAHMRIRKRGREISHVELVLREGRNREIRRIFARLRHPVLSLRRVSLGPLELAGLRLGQVRRLSPEEVKALYRAAREGVAAASPAEPLRPHAHRRGGPRPPHGGGSRGPHHGGSRAPHRGGSRAPRPSKVPPRRGARGAPRKGTPR